MGKCFVIQPFDGGPFDKRFDDVFAPAIKAARLEPYRVDRDPSVSIPIVDIEKGIKDSDICLAEITTDNPNVWFELGYALALQKEVVLICSEDRKTRFPFDVQHRNIIKYISESPRDFTVLGNAITERLSALLKKENGIARIASSTLLADTEGLSQHEVVALATVMQNQFSPQDFVPAYRIREDMNKAGFTDIAVSLSLRSLIRKEFLSSDLTQDMNGESYPTYKVIEKGENWLLQNQDKLQLKSMGREQESHKDDLPF
jgi:nucleoside 2-deoxyribosyltransferase